MTGQNPRITESAACGIRYEPIQCMSSLSGWTIPGGYEMDILGWVVICVRLFND